MMKFNIKHLLEVKQMSMYKLAKTAGIDYATIHNLTTNKKPQISLDLVEKICSALGVQPGDLFIRINEAG